MAKRFEVTWRLVYKFLVVLPPESDFHVFYICLQETLDNYYQNAVRGKQTVPFGNNLADKSTKSSALIFCWFLRFYDPSLVILNPQGTSRKHRHPSTRNISCSEYIHSQVALLHWHSRFPQETEMLPTWSITPVVYPFSPRRLISQLLPDKKPENTLALQDANCFALILRL